jgi:Zn-dependent protease with chaperone function
VARKETLLLIPFAIAAIAGLALLVVLIAKVPFSGIFKIPSPYDPAYIQDRIALPLKVLALFCLPFVIYLGFVCVDRARYARGRFDYFTGQHTDDYEPTSLLKFQEALDGVGIAAGIQAPVLVILDDPAPNAMAFTDAEGIFFMGITKGLLEADISVGEANAIMAHETAHLIIGENVKPPSLWGIEFLPSVLLVVFGVLALVSIVLLKVELSVILIAWSITILIFLSLILIQRSEGFILKQLDLAYKHDDILADSVAAYISKDPQGLQNAIKKIDAFMKENPRTPGGAILARYLFVTPPTSTGDYYRYATQTVSGMLSGEKQPRTWFHFSKCTNRAMQEILELESRVTSERLTNLELIKQGRHRLISDWERGG